MYIALHIEIQMYQIQLLFMVTHADSHSLLLMKQFEKVNANVESGK